MKPRYFIAHRPTVHPDGKPLPAGKAVQVSIANEAWFSSVVFHGDGEFTTTPPAAPAPQQADTPRPDSKRSKK